MTELNWKDRADQLPEMYQGRNLSEDEKETLRERYRQMQYEPGESIGVVAAQSLSEPATQLTMETYHQAGGAQVSLTAGLPRLIEIVDARRNPKTPAMDVYLHEDYNSKEDALNVARKLRQVVFEDLITQDTIDIMQLQVEYNLNPDLLDDYDISMEDVKQRVEESVRKSDVSIEDNNMIVESSEEDYDLKDLKKIKNKVEESRIKGLKGIEQVVVNQEDDEWRLQTAGTSLRKTLKIEEVDENRTISNDLFEILSVLGIEALRQSIINEVNETLEAQGIGVDDRHIMLLADMMTKEGDLNGTTRYGIMGNKESLLARSVFEETKKHLRQGSLRGETDDLEGVIENILVGQPIPVGTGAVDLKPKFAPEEE
ncbi:DNA-directed RNA polymerase subunit A'' [Nanohaloarchaea archaeon]|nr:DNA-directed RNA polymerase subunit A'' [Nanohaloarchaea archaeon H01]NMJ77114.1 DNA-directed RNA polymerase subunit A'' [Candidatus Nanohaloarchaea archaeon]